MSVKRALLSGFSVAFVILIFIGAIFISQNRDRNGISVNEYASSEMKYSNGNVASFDDKNFGTANKGDVATVHLSLPDKPIVQDGVLAFYIYHSVTEVTCNGKMLEEYGADINAKGAMVGGKRFLISIPDDAWGGDITITLNCTEDRAFNCINNLYVYESKYAYQYYFDRDFIGFCIAWPLLVIGLMAVGAVVIGRRIDVIGRKCLYIALLAILASLWILLTEGTQNLFGLSGYAWTQIEYIAGFAMPIPILIYAFEAETSKWFKKILGIALIIGVVFLVVATILNFTNIAHYCETLLLSNVLTFLCGILFLIFALKSKKQSGKNENILFNGMIILFIAGLFDVLRLSVFIYLPNLVGIRFPSVLSIGLLFFIICIVRSYGQELVESHKAHIVAEVTAKNLSEMLRCTPAGICLFKVEHGMPIIEANETFYSIFGYTKESALEAGFDNLEFPLDENELQKLADFDEFLLVGKTAGAHEIELSITKSNGCKGTILSTFYYHGIEENRITTNVIDITQRKKLEEALRLSEERYKLALMQSGKVFFFFDVPSRTMRLSDELAQAFGLPNEVDNMPENFISRGLVEPESESVYRDFYIRIINGEESGDAIISCHMRDTPDNIMWYKIAFSSLFDSEGRPASAIITYEDLSERHHALLASEWKPLNLVNVPEKSYVIVEYDLTRGVILSQVGGLFAEMPDFMKKYEDINAFVLASFIHEDDVKAYDKFLDRNRLLEMFKNGEREDYYVYRSMQNESEYRWTSTAIQMVEDPYSKHVMGQLLFVDIHDQKTGQIEMKQNIAELKEELENSRIKILINQMQPHFLYNALSAIRTITRHDPEYAYGLLYDFTTHLRSSIKALSSDELISFTDELKNIKAYLNIEKMRFGDSLNINYEIETEDFKVVSLAVQPLAENAVRHGVYSRGDEGGTVTIRSYETEEFYIVNVEDDGVGFDVETALKKESDSVGIKNSMFRLESLMNTKLIITSEIGKGTKAELRIPKKSDDEIKQRGPR